MAKQKAKLPTVEYTRRKFRPSTATIVVLGLLICCVVWYAGYIHAACEFADHDCSSHTMEREAVRLGYGEYQDDGLWNGRDQFVWKVSR